MRRTFSLVQNFAALLRYKFPQLPSGNDCIFDIVCAAYRASNTCSTSPIWRSFRIGTANEAFHVLRLPYCDLTQIQRTVGLAGSNRMACAPLKANRRSAKLRESRPVSSACAVWPTPATTPRPSAQSPTVTAQHHERDQPPDCPLGIGICADKLSHVTDWRRFRLDTAPPWQPRWRVPPAKQPGSGRLPFSLVRDRLTTLPLAFHRRGIRPTTPCRLLDSEVDPIKPPVQSSTTWAEISIRAARIPARRPPALTASFRG